MVFKKPGAERSGLFFSNSYNGSADWLIESSHSGTCVHFMFPTHLLSGRANDLGRTTIGPGNQELLSAVLEWTEPRWSLLARFIGLAGGLALLSYGLWSHRRGDSALPYLGPLGILSDHRPMVYPRRFPNGSENVIPILCTPLTSLAIQSDPLPTRIVSVLLPRNQNNQPP